MATDTMMFGSFPDLGRVVTLLLDLFDRSSDLVRFVRLHLAHGKRLAQALPEGAPLDEVAFETAQLLARQGILHDDFFDALVHEFPARASDVNAVRKRVLEPPQRPYPAPLRGPGDGPSRMRRDPSTPRALPALPHPTWFFGRDELADQIAAKVVQESVEPIAILGPGGVGKSTLAIAVLHRDKVVKHFGAHRYFVRLEAAPTARAVLDQLGNAFGMAVGAVSLREVRTFLGAERMLLVLDMVEVPWLLDQRATEELLPQLCNTAQTALVITMRGTTRPYGLRWDTSIAPLQPLPDWAARALFRAVANLEPALIEEPTLDEIVKDLDGVPLAVKLLAHRAEGNLLSNLKDEWTEKRLALLEPSTMTADRLSSWVVSVELSWDSPRMTMPARRLASMIACLDDGIAIADAGLLLPDDGHGAARVLGQVSLAYPEDGRLRMLVPVRDHIRENYPPGRADRERMMAHYRQLALELGPRSGRPGGREAVARLAPEMANLDTVIRRGLHGKQQAAWIDAAVALTRFARFSGRTALSALVPAATAARMLGDVRRWAQCERSLAEIALHRGEYRRAEAHLSVAQPHFQRIGDLAGHASCLKGRGHVALHKLNYDLACMHYFEAQVLYDQVGDRAGKANCTYNLGVVALRREQFTEAREYFTEALPTYHLVGDVFGQARCTLSLGHLALITRDLDTASGHYGQAGPLFEQVGSLRGLADCTMSLGHVELQRYQLDAARGHYQAAQTMWEQGGDVVGQAECWSSLGAVAMALDQRDQARACYLKAARRYEQIPDGVALGMVQCQLARLSSSPAERTGHVAAARRAFNALERQDLLAQLDKEFPPAAPDDHDDPR